MVYLDSKDQGERELVKIRQNGMLELLRLQDKGIERSVDYK